MAKIQFFFVWKRFCLCFFFVILRIYTSTLGKGTEEQKIKTVFTIIYKLRSRWGEKKTQKKTKAWNKLENKPRNPSINIYKCANVTHKNLKNKTKKQPQSVLKVHCLSTTETLRGGEIIPYLEGVLLKKKKIYINHSYPSVVLK